MWKKRKAFLHEMKTGVNKISEKDQQLEKQMKLEQRMKEGELERTEKQASICYWK